MNHTGICRKATVGTFPLGIRKPVVVRGKLRPQDRHPAGGSTGKHSVRDIAPQLSPRKQAVGPSARGSAQLGPTRDRHLAPKRSRDGRRHAGTFYGALRQLHASRTACSPSVCRSHCVSRSGSGGQARIPVRPLSRSWRHRFPGRDVHQVLVHDRDGVLIVLNFRGIKPV